MYFARPTRLTENYRIEATFDSLPIASAFHQICEGEVVSDVNSSDYVNQLHHGIMATSHVYAMVFDERIQLPIASFYLDNEGRMAILMHLLSQHTLRTGNRFGHAVAGPIRLYCVDIFRIESNVDAIAIPGRMPGLDDPRWDIIYENETTVIQRKQIAG